MTQMGGDANTAGTTRPFDGFDKLTAGKLRAPSKVEGLTLAATRACRRSLPREEEVGADGAAPSNTASCEGWRPPDHSLTLAATCTQNRSGATGAGLPHGLRSP